MATSKTLTPTNQIISIPELTDAPDMSVASDAISKEADAINAIDGRITTYYDSSTTYTTLDAIKTMLSTLASSMSNQQIKNVVIHTGTNTSLAPFTSWGYFSGFIAKNDSTYWSAHFVGVDGTDIEIGCNNGTITVSSLNEQLANLITTEKFTITISESVAANTSKSYTKSVAKTGYTPIGIIQQYGSGTGSFAFQDCYIVNNTDAMVYVRNVTSSAATLNNIQIVVLYMKS